MKFSFLKISNQQIPFEIELGELKFLGNLKRKDSKIVLCEAKISGKAPHQCDRCGDDIVLNLKEDVRLLLSDGVCDVKDSESFYDIVECFDGEVDLNDVLVSELEAYKSDYFYCEKCKNL